MASLARFLSSNQRLLSIANRTVEKANELAEHFKFIDSLNVLSLNQLEGKTFDLIVIARLKVYMAKTLISRRPS